MTTIDVNAILDELRLGHDTSEPTTAMMTLLAYSDDPVTIARMRERVRSIVLRHPSRMIVFDATMNPQSHEVETIVSRENHHEIARAEWVDLGVRGVDAGELASIAHAISLQDVPIFLLWAGQGMMRDPAFGVLTQFADSLILDSSRVGSDTTALHELLEFFSEGQHYAVQDLAYLRLAPWQEMIAQFFDEDDAACELSELRNVSIVTGSLAEAYYFVGWLASRLSWTPTSPKTFANPSGAPVAFDVQLQGDPRRIRSIELRSAGTTFRAALQEGHDEVVCLTAEGTVTRQLHCEPLHDISNVDLVERSILMPHISDMYRETLDAVKATLAASEES